MKRLKHYSATQRGMFASKEVIDMECEQIVNDQDFYYSCGEPAVIVLDDIPVCAKHLEEATGQMLEEEDFSTEDLMAMAERRDDR